MTDCERAPLQQQQQQQRRQIPVGRGFSDDDGGRAMGSEEEGSSSKLWDGVVADDRRIGSEECLKLWMELEARCGDGHVGAVEGGVESLNDVVAEIVPPSSEQADCDDDLERRREDAARDERQGSTSRDKDEWSPAETISLLEAYGERLGDGRAGSLKAKEWEEVAEAVNQHFNGSALGLATKSLKQCKRKIYALRRWYKSVVSKQMTFRQDGYEHTLLCVLARIMAPSGHCRPGIPGGIDAGECLSVLQTSSLFDEVEEEEELIQETRAARPHHLAEEFMGMVSSMQSGKRIVMPDGRKRGAGMASKTGTTDSSCGDENPSCKKPCLSSCGDISHSGEVVSALNSFAKVLAQVEQTKMEIMKDLDRRRTELQLKLANIDAYDPDQSDESPPSAMLNLL